MTQFENETDQATRKAVIKHDQMATTYFERAQAEIGSEMGRFKSLNKQTVVGASGGPVYPRLPPSSPFANDPVPPPEPLGFSVDEMEAVGTPQEVAASLADTPLTAPTESSPAVETGGVSALPLKRRA